MPLAQQFLLDLVAPPVLAGLWWFFSRGWAAGVQAGQISSETRNRQKIGFFVVLALLYVAMLGLQFTTIFRSSLRRSNGR
jgi:undecaprenyl pyrophosphate phosphatase UppP